MKTKRSPISYLFIVGVQALTLSYAELSPRRAEAAYDYNISQIAPVNLTMTQIAAILNHTAPSADAPNKPYLNAYQQTTTTDATGAIVLLAPVKVVQTDDPNHPYLGVFHNQVTTTKFATYAAYSLDLFKWHTLGAIDDVALNEYGSQPDIRILPDDSVLFAEEYNPASKPQIRVRYYGGTAAETGLQAFILNPGVTPTNQITLPNINRLSQADGTPEFGRIDYNGSILSAKVEVTHHYFNLGVRDLQAVGTLTNFKRWSDSTDTTINNLVTNAGGNGKIGDREVFKVGSTVYEVVEAQVNPTSGSDYGSWRLFFINKTLNTIQQLSPVLVGGAQSLGNPTVSFITLPGGGPALVFTCFVFSENDGTTLPGGHMYVYPL